MYGLKVVLSQHFGHPESGLYIVIYRGPLLQLWNPLPMARLAEGNRDTIIRALPLLSSDVPLPFLGEEVPFLVLIVSKMELEGITALRRLPFLREIKLAKVVGKILLNSLLSI